MDFLPLLYLQDVTNILITYVRHYRWEIGIVRNSEMMEAIKESEEAKKGKAGRPPKVDEPFLEYFSRKK